MVGRSHLDLHHARPQVPEQRLAGVFVGEGVEETLSGEAPHLRGGAGTSFLETRTENLFYSNTERAAGSIGQLKTLIRAQKFPVKT